MDLRAAVTSTVYHASTKTYSAPAQTWWRKNVSLAASDEVGPVATPGHSDMRVGAAGE